MGFDRIDAEGMKQLKARWVAAQEDYVKANGALQAARFRLSNLEARPDSDVATWIYDVAEARSEIQYAADDLKRAQEKYEHSFDKQIAERWG